jgi:hypothetical protein
MSNNEVRFGDLVRSYDFQNRVDCWVEGVVIGFEEFEGCPRYVVHVTRVVSVHEDITDRLGGHKYPSQVLPPVNGTPRTFGGTCNGVEVLDRQEVNNI